MLILYLPMKKKPVHLPEWDLKMLCIKLPKCVVLPLLKRVLMGRLLKVKDNYRKFLPAKHHP